MRLQVRSKLCLLETAIHADCGLMERRSAGVRMSVDRLILLRVSLELSQWAGIIRVGYSRMER